MEEKIHTLITNDAVVLGLLLLVLAFIFTTSASEKKAWQRFYTFIPALLLCYFIPAIFNSPITINGEGYRLIDGEASNLYHVASRYLLPASLVLLCVSIDLKGILKLGPKAIVMFFTATIGIIIGGPIALLTVSSFAPEVLNGQGSEEIWRGLSTVAGSWIGGGANQAAMKEIYGPSDTLFSAMIVVDVFVANIWMAFLLFGAGITKKLDNWLKADSSAITELQTNIENYQANTAFIPKTKDLMTIMAIAFGAVAISHWLADIISPALEGFIENKISMDSESGWKYLTSLSSGFFWLVIIATTLGVLVSFTKYRKLEGAGASKIGSVFLYVLVTTIGMHMNISELINNWAVFKFLILVGLIWIFIHVLLLMLIAKIIKAPFFFVAVGSQANVGGAASAPIVASAFSPALAPVGVLLAVWGYALGTYGAIFCAELMKYISV